MKYRILQVDIYSPQGEMKQTCIDTLRPNVIVDDVEAYRKEMKMENPNCDVYVGVIALTLKRKSTKVGC